MFEQQILDIYTTQTLNANYTHINPNRVATNQKDMNTNQHHNLKQALDKYGKLFDDLLLSTLTKRSTSILYLTWSKYTTEHIP